MTHTTRLYFEAHITVRPPDVKVSEAKNVWDVFSRNAELNGWRASRFDVDEVDHYDGAWFLSGREENYDFLMERTQRMSRLLIASEFEFIRAKIENTLFDTKHGDVL